MPLVLPLVLVASGLLGAAACTAEPGEIALVIESSTGSSEYVVDLKRLPRDVVEQQGCALIGESATRLPSDLGLPDPVVGDLGEGTLVGFALGEEEWDAQHCAEYLEENPVSG